MANSIVVTNNYTSYPITTTEASVNPLKLFTKAPNFGPVNNCDAPVLWGDVNLNVNENTSPEGVLIGSKNVNQ